MAISLVVTLFLITSLLINVNIVKSQDGGLLYFPLILKGKPSQVRWFVGLGPGSDESTFEAQQAIVDEFNASHDEIELVLEIVPNDVAYDTLAAQIASGNAPDIVGPVGVRGRDYFYGEWANLQPFIDANDYDLSDFDPAMVEFYQVEGEGQLGIPFVIYPSFVLYNKDLFDEAGLNYPPAAYGEPYVWPDDTEAEWNMETLKAVAMILTVDINGNDATMDEFDHENIVQFGWLNQWTDARSVGTFFDAGSLLADDGETAQIPEPWRAAWNWTYDGWWNDWFIPNGYYAGADFLQSGGGAFGSGNMGAIHMHAWYVADWALDGSFAFDFAPTPSYEGTVTSKMHADTFHIPKASQNKEEAFEVMTYLLSPEIARSLLKAYGGGSSIPGRLSLQEEWEYAFPEMDLNWDVVLAGAAYADNPNHESWMPSFQETTDTLNEFWAHLTYTPDLDVDAEIQVLRQHIQDIFDEALQ